MSEKGIINLEEYILEDKNISNYQEVIKQLIEKDIPILYLLDGLDEIIIERDEIFKNILLFKEKKSKNKIIISTRQNGITNKEIQLLEEKYSFSLASVQSLTLENLTNYFIYLNEINFFRETEVNF
jgi:predicted NACHT family NTPase